MGTPFGKPCGPIVGAVHTKQASRCQHEPVQTAYGDILPPLFSLVQRERGRDEAIRLVTSGKGPQSQEISCHALISLIQLVLHLQSTKLAPFSHTSKGYEDGWNGTVSGYVQLPHDKRNECLGGVHKRRLQREEKTSVYMSHLYFYFSLLTDWALGFPWAIKGGQRYWQWGQRNSEKSKRTSKNTRAHTPFR